MIKINTNKKNLGFTIIEVIVACSIISISMLALMQTAQKLSKSSSQTPLNLVLEHATLTDYDSTLEGLLEVFYLLPMGPVNVTKMFSEQIIAKQVVEMQQ